MTTLKLLNEKIENIAEMKEEEIERNNYIKYKYVFDETVNILKTMNVLLYGGTALNDFLPSNLKIYEEQVLPDIDIFCVNAEKKAKIIENKLIKKNFKAVSVSEAMHPGTYKIFAQGLQVIDITDIPYNAFKILLKNSTKGSMGITIVNYEFLRLSLHMMLSQSNDAHRWPKVFKRLINYYTYMPPTDSNSSCLISLKLDNDYLSAVNLIYSYLKNSEFVLFGPNEINMISNNLNKNTIKPEVFILAKTDNLTKTMSKIVNKLNKTTHQKDFTIKNIYENNNFIYDFGIISYKDQPIISIFKCESCMTYNEYEGLRIATINTIIRMFLGIILSDHTFFNKWKNILKCYVDKLSILELKNKDSDKPLLQTFVKNCYGESEGLVTLRKNRILRLYKS